MCVDESAICIIAEILNCETKEIQNLTAMKMGMTNLSYSFKFGDKFFIARIPGEGTGRLIDREQEYSVYKKIAPLNICDDVVHINPKTGHKVTVFWENVRVCDPNNNNDVSACMKMLRDFHSCKLKVPHTFDVFERIEFYESLWNVPSCYEDYKNTKVNVLELKKYIADCKKDFVLTHIDAVPDNFLFLETENGKAELRLIDWEYAAMQDPHLDIAMFIVYSMYTREQAENLIDIYFQEDCLPDVRVKIYAYIAMCGLLWSNWCEYKRQYGIEFGEYALKQYQFAKEYFSVFWEAQSAL